MSELTHRKRTATMKRTTGETDIRLAFDLDGTGVSRSNTGVFFLDHMLDALSRHGRFSIDLSCTGDTEHTNPHHTVEDVGIAMGQAGLRFPGRPRGMREVCLCLRPTR